MKLVFEIPFSHMRALRALTDEQLGRLFMAIYAYANDQMELIKEDEPSELQLAFAFIKNGISWYEE
ncbi:MAG: DUF6291 domain-containing protein [Bacillota bacterium]|jgi:hypothetical protein